MVITNYVGKSGGDGNSDDEYIAFARVLVVVIALIFIVCHIMKIIAMYYIENEGLITSSS